MFGKRGKPSVLSPTDRNGRDAAFASGPFLVFLAFLGMGLLFLTFMFILPAKTVYAARNWVVTDCTILSSKVGEHSGRKGGHTYSVDIEFRYFYNDKTYTSNRYNVFSPKFSSSGRSGKERVVQRYAPGSAAVCYVNPARPSEALLDRSWPAAILFGLIPLVFVLIGGGGHVLAVQTAQEINQGLTLVIRLSVTIAHDTSSVVAPLPAL